MAVIERIPLDLIPKSYPEWYLWDALWLLLDPFCVKPELWELKSLHLLVNSTKVNQNISMSDAKKKNCWHPLHEYLVVLQVNYCFLIESRSSKKLISQKMF